jgi:hypothetical protein
VERKAVDKYSQFSSFSCLWKSEKIFHTPCGKKVVAPLAKKPLFHISLYYCYDYCINDLLLFILLFIDRKEERYAFYL